MERKQVIEIKAVREDQNLFVEGYAAVFGTLIVITTESKRVRLSILSMAQTEIG